MFLEHQFLWTDDHLLNTMFLFNLLLLLVEAQKCNNEVLCKKEYMCNFDHDTAVWFNLLIKHTNSI